MSRILLEVCVDDCAGIAAAVAGGADRIELCAALAMGGLTPSAGLMAQAADCGLPVLAMIRPHAGAFVWSPDDLRAMEVEIAAARDFGLAGVVIGASYPDGRLDAAALARLVAAAGGMDITLHRAIDLAPDPAAAMQLCRDLGIRRVLSSGGAGTAVQGLPRLLQMAAAAMGVTVMPGGGITAANASLLAEWLPVTEVHASCASALPDPEDSRIAAFGFQLPGARGTDVAKVQALRQALDQIGRSRPSGWISS